MEEVFSGKYYQKDLQQISFGYNKKVSPGDKFYKFISSNEFDPEKYSLVTVYHLKGHWTDNNKPQLILLKKIFLS